VIPAVNPPPYTNEIILANVFFKNVDGKTLTLHDIPISWKVEELREKLEREKAIDTGEYRFLWGGKQLQDENTLESYGVGKVRFIPCYFPLPIDLT
jgi:Ubiquitin family